MNEIFVRIDCDNVGDRIELALYKGETDTAQKVSDLIKKNIALFCENVKIRLSAQILLIGADDVLFKTTKIESVINELNLLKDEFISATGITLSIGVGHTLLQCINNLNIAKYSGKNVIIFQ